MPNWIHVWKSACALFAAPTRGGDRLDVRRRARRSRRRTLALAAAAAVLVALPTIALGGRLLDVLAVTVSDECVPAPAAAALPP